MPTAVFGATQPIQMRVEELISGVRATLALKLYGEDLATLDRLTGQMKNVLSQVPGVADLAAEANKGKPQLIIKVDREAASRYGINADEILEVVKCGIGGSAVSTLIDGTSASTSPSVWRTTFRADPAAIAGIPIRTGERRAGPVLAGGLHRARRGLFVHAARGAAALLGAADGREGPRRRQLRQGGRRCS